MDETDHVDGETKEDKKLSVNDACEKQVVKYICWGFNISKNTVYTFFSGVSIKNMYGSKSKSANQFQLDMKFS